MTITPSGLFICTSHFAESPKFNPKARQNPGFKLFTLYYTGRSPGQFSTRLTRLPVDSDGQPILRRQKREDDIRPTQVEPILATQPPADSYYELDVAVGDSMLEELNNLFELFSSFEVTNDKWRLDDVKTVTETVTVTKKAGLCSDPIK